ncbi:MAG: Arm DNA-binding domain-containing protein [Roseovarius sp.]|nr:Arm DNA-binding domain-containing protein [Roseovarius sp.]
MSAIEVSRLSADDGAGVKAVPVGGVAGLRLKIRPSGGRSWVLRTMIGGKRTDVVLGGYPDVTLAEARRKAKDMKEAIATGVGPVRERKEARAALVAERAEQDRRSRTFREAFAAFMETKGAELGSERRALNWSSGLRTHALPVIGDRRLVDITRDDMRDVLKPIWTSNTVTATRLRQRLHAIFASAIAAGHCDPPNPAEWSGNLDAFLPKPHAIAKPKH